MGGSGLQELALEEGHTCDKCEGSPMTRRRAFVRDRFVKYLAMRLPVSPKSWVSANTPAGNRGMVHFQPTRKEENARLPYCRRPCEAARGTSAIAPGRARIRRTHKGGRVLPRRRIALLATRGWPHSHSIPGQRASTIAPSPHGEKGCGNGFRLAEHLLCPQLLEPL